MSKKKDELQLTPFQYQKAGAAFVRCGDTFKSLEAGFYSVTNCGSYGWGLSPKPIVSDDLIDIPGTVADDIFVDIDTFLANRDRYMQYGLTHKRGYLFYGPPGSGKTSLAQMIARRFIEKVGGIVIYVSNYNELYHGVDIMRDVEPGRPSMYLIEEADNVVNNTYALSILDGELSIQGAVFVAMTNYKELLPPRIANRPGRFDRVMYVGCPPVAVQLEYLRRVAARGDAPGGLEAPQRIVSTLQGLPLSMAHLREAFISHVLMGIDLLEIRDRFDQMAGVERDENDQIVVPAEEEDEDDSDDDSDDDDLYLSDDDPRDYDERNLD